MPEQQFYSTILHLLPLLFYDIILLMLVRLQRATEILLGSLWLFCLLTADTWARGTDPMARIHAYTRAVEFDYFDWTLNALEDKWLQSASGSPFYFTDLAQWQIVQDYLQITQQILENEAQLERLYADPAIADPERASQEVRARLQSLYAQQRPLAPLAEAVLEQQVSATLAELGLTSGGQPIPPVAFHISPMPWHLVISPRDRIEQQAAISLLPGLRVDQHAALEEQIDRAFNVSSLVVPIGGVGTYPTMVMRSTALDWLIETIAHEWTHNWLSLRPLGIHYDSSPELRTMNETAASIAGREIAHEVLARYYPYLLADLNHPVVLSAQVQQEEETFDFNREMHRTRVHVDELLAQGKIEEAEAYMEARRLVFWEHGFPIRKLNQAYFAFYGAYADTPVGAAGEDPVGPAVRALRARSPSLAAFLKTLAAMDSFQDLQDVLQQPPVSHARLTLPVPPSEVPLCPSGYLLSY